MDERPVYRRPDWFTFHVFNPAVAALTRAGVSVLGSRVLRVRGRTSGVWRETPVNLLTMDGLHFLVAPRGETQWVRNLRASGGGEPVSYTHLRAHETVLDLVCRLLLEKTKNI